MNILLISHYMIFPSEGGNSRFCYILDLLKKKAENKIELLTSDFRHETKNKHNLSKKDIKKLGYKVTFIHEPYYKKNICLKRIISAIIFSKNAKKYLNSLQELPDVIYCAVPSLHIAKVATEFAKSHNIKIIIDIQDLWPEAFRMIANPPILGKIIYSPIEKMANSIYRSADEIIAVSDTYANRARKVAKTKKIYTIYLGTDLKKFDNNIKNKRIAYEIHINSKRPKPIIINGKQLPNKRPDDIWVAYCGTLGSSYDIGGTIKAIASINNKNIRLIIMGDGPLRNKFEEQAKNSAINYTFTGRLPYEQMCYILKHCDIAVNPIMHNAAQSIINKHSDYLASGLPIVSTQENIEFRKLVEKYSIGYNCSNEEISEMASRIKELTNNESLRKKLGKNSRRLAESLFNRRHTYQKIVKIIMGAEE